MVVEMDSLVVKLAARAAEMMVAQSACAKVLGIHIELQSCPHPDLHIQAANLSFLHITFLIKNIKKL